MKNVLKIVVDASLKAGACILGYYKSEYEIKEKGYHNPVTTADHAANDILKKILLNRCRKIVSQNNYLIIVPILSNLGSHVLKSSEKYENKASPSIKFSGISPQYLESKLSSLLSPIAQ